MVRRKILAAAVLEVGCGRGADAPSGSAGRASPPETGERTGAAPSAQGGDERTSAPPLPYRQAGLSFPHPPKPANAHMMAQGGGGLFVEDGCIRMGDRNRSWVVVWPYGYSLSRKGGDVRVPDKRGEEEARVGDEVRMGGGEIAKDGLAATPEGERRAFEQYREKMGVPDRCAGLLWVASPGMRVIREG